MFAAVGLTPMIADGVIDVDAEEGAEAEAAPEASLCEAKVISVEPTNLDDIKDALLDIVPEMAKRINVGVDEKLSDAPEHNVFLWEVKNISALPSEIQKIATERQKVFSSSPNLTPHA